MSKVKVAARHQQLLVDRDHLLRVVLFYLFELPLLFRLVFLSFFFGLFGLVVLLSVDDSAVELETRVSHKHFVEKLGEEGDFEGSFFVVVSPGKDFSVKLPKWLQK